MRDRCAAAICEMGQETARLPAALTSANMTVHAAAAPPPRPPELHVGFPRQPGPAGRLAFGSAS